MQGDPTRTRALDLGCGQGRNTLFPANRAGVTAVDPGELVLEILRSIVEQEDLDLPVGTTSAQWSAQTYDLIVSTVVLVTCRRADSGYYP